jgi:hypothetical protein
MEKANTIIFTIEQMQHSPNRPHSQKHTIINCLSCWLKQISFNKTCTPLQYSKVLTKQCKNWTGTQSFSLESHDNGLTNKINTLNSGRTNKKDSQAPSGPKLCAPSSLLNGSNCGTSAIAIDTAWIRPKRRSNQRNRGTLHIHCRTRSYEDIGPTKTRRHRSPRHRI